MVQREIPVTMKAMILTEPGQWEIGETEVPEPGEEEVLCRIDAVAICGSDPEIIHGGLAGIWPPSYPFIAGHEWAGTVVKKGNNVTDLELGDRVAGEAHKGCGYCKNCLRGRYTLCLNYGKNEAGHRHYGFTSQGAYAQYNTYHQKSLTKLPDQITFEEASMCDTAGVALHGLELAGVEPGSTVVVIGPGPIGMMAMKLAKAMGAGKVIVVGRNPRLESAKQLGADELVDFSLTDPVIEVRRFTGSRGADLVLECSGAPGTIVQGLEMCGKGGKVVMLGVAKDGITEAIPLKYTTHNELTLLGSRANPNTGRKVVNMIAGNRIEVKDLITHTFPLEEIGSAFETFEQRLDGAMKVVIYPNKKEL
ncbi:MAG: zinc-dependent alcohol dehydrogenase [Lachnospiraceae bacterium]